MGEYLAIDPGDTTGWAVFKEDGNIEEFDDINTKSRESIIGLLNGKRPVLVICEDFTLMPWKARDLSFDNLNTVRLIGWIESWCYSNGVQLVKQPNSIKPIAYMWAGIKAPKTKSHTHKTDAYVHGVYYLQKEGIRKPQQGLVT